MPFTRRALFLGITVSVAALTQTKEPDQYPDAAPYVPTPVEVVDAMLSEVGVRPSDVVYDLGCGDGRIVIMAAQKFGATAVGVEIDGDLVREARARAEKLGVAGKVKFLEADIFATDIRSATVVAVYLTPKALVRLKPKLLTELKPGSRIVSFTFPIEGWKPAKVRDVNSRRVFLYIIPER